MQTSFDRFLGAILEPCGPDCECNQPADRFKAVSLEQFMSDLMDSAKNRDNRNEADFNDAMNQAPDPEASGGGGFIDQVDRSKDDEDDKRHAIAALMRVAENMSEVSLILARLVDETIVNPKD